jgi:hypothetical protein
MSLGVGHLEEGIGCRHIFGLHLDLLDVPQVAVGLAFSQGLVSYTHRFGPLVLRVLD